MKILSLFFLFLALFLFSVASNNVYKRLNPQQLAFSTMPSQSSTADKSSIPVSIAIPSQNISLPIFPSRIMNNHWETTDKGVSYVISSPAPGEKGNSIFYGHNFTNILGNLPKVKPGEKIIITMANGEKRIFVADKTAIVSPTDYSVLNSTDEKNLTIYTCTGFLDSKRFVVKAIPFSS